MSYEYFARIDHIEGLIEVIRQWIRSNDLYEIIPTEDSSQIIARITTIPKREQWSEDMEIRADGDQIYVAFGALDRELRETILRELAVFLVSHGIRADFIEE